MSIYGLDLFGHDVIRGYGVCHLPLKTGHHEKRYCSNKARGRKSNFESTLNIYAVKISIFLNFSFYGKYLFCVL